MAKKMSIAQAKEKLQKVNLAIKQVVESKNKSSATLDTILQLKEVKTNLTNLINEAGEKTAFVKTKKGEKFTIDYKTAQDLKPTADNSDIEAIKTATGDFQKGTFTEEAGRKYTAEESEAVGNEILDEFEQAIRAKKGEFSIKPQVTGHENGFTIHATYARDKGEDNFKFILNPDDSTIYLKSGREDQKVATFTVTQANEVTIDAEADLKTILQTLMTKYVSEPTDPSQLTGELDERKLKDLTGDGEITQADVLRARGVKFKNEDLDVGHQDDEPAMLKSDVYRIAKMASMLYKQLDQYDQMQGEVDFPHWWQAKITKAYDYLQSAYGYLDGEEKTQEIDNTVVTTVALSEKKATYCGNCGHTHVKGTPCPKNETSHTVSQIDKFISERKKALRESLGKDASVGDYVKDFQKSDAPQFAGKSKEKRAEMAVAAALQAKPVKEDIGDYVGEPDNEAHMLKADVYRITKAAAELYKMLQALDQQGSVDFPQWIQIKITEAADKIQCAKDYLEFETQEPAIDQAINTLGETSEGENDQLKKGDQIIWTAPSKQIDKLTSVATGDKGEYVGRQGGEEVVAFNGRNFYTSRGTFKLSGTTNQ